MDINHRFSLTKVHFDRWLALFSNTVDELFENDNANLAQQRALSIATVIQIEIQSASFET